MCSHRPFENPSLFVAIDGDDVGTRLEALVLQGRLADVRLFSQQVAATVATIATNLESMGAEVVFAGGDNILAGFGQSAANLAWLHELPGAPCTFSAGIGQDAATAQLALHLAKGLGKHRTIDYATWIRRPREAE